MLGSAVWERCDVAAPIRKKSGRLMRLGLGWRGRTGRAWKIGDDGEVDVERRDGRTIGLERAGKGKDELDLKVSHHVINGINWATARNLFFGFIFRFSYHGFVPLGTQKSPF
eukprot:GFKZ01002168.1.p1 GENE.GFKZ01002168.1~~GFKZ01002168.1.p1  ORF type:complete len:112 (-),score=11.25 GFKZ01002168.1:179-514(-)